ncbi:ESX-1 secretion-associated protein EspK [Mycobacterium marinum]|uniref:hypothetical protein n=1 Tax=Mycobacterium marinum TaxID=1781 RepID=UPI000E28C43F|nr:hypothetical protein [Mycobacterium marinum]AXN42143.1 ESX-1 secretion-associated protein EspK [Mycobacterium marinum]RFZ05079.1 ESX-1 secretion-associated protein EspK [Mycobacterium marinum]
MPQIVKKPDTPNSEAMLEPNGWPNVYELDLINQARDYFMAHKQLSEVHSACLKQMSEMFTKDVWSGDAAEAAHAKLSDFSSRLETVVKQLLGVYIWYGDMAALLMTVKKRICMLVIETEAEVDELEASAEENPAAPLQIMALLAEANASNTAMVVTVATALQTGLGLIPEDLFPAIDMNSPADYLPDLDPPLPPLPAPISNNIPKPIRPLLGQQEQASDSTSSDTVQPTSGSTPAATSVPTSGATAALSPLSSLSSLSSMASMASMSGAGMSGSSAADPQGPPSSEPDTSAAEPAAAPVPTGGGGAHPGGQGIRPQFLGPQIGASSPVPQADPAAAAAGASSASAAPTTSFASGGAAAGPGVRSSAPVAGTRSGRTSITPAADKSAGKAPVHARSTADGDFAGTAETMDADALVAIPVAAALAERDAIAAASTPRTSEAPDPLALARRIAAALNAPDVGGTDDFGFFWVTAVTADGEIVVANSYGLAYIPDGVHLPAAVHMASSDRGIAASERARWATYPVMAVQGWAAHHNATLRAIIATEEQLANCDPGVPKILLQPDEIPDTGQMGGRTRLEVVDPRAAKRLAATVDARLIDLLPAAPADANAPVDRRHRLWFEVLKPMGSECAGREIAHVAEFYNYAAHSQEILLWRAHNAADADAQRAAVTDWLYWLYITAQLDSAQAIAA